MPLPMFCQELFAAIASSNNASSEFCSPSAAAPLSWVLRLLCLPFFELLVRNPITSVLSTVSSWSRSSASAADSAAAIALFGVAVAGLKLSPSTSFSCPERTGAVAVSDPLAKSLNHRSDEDFGVDACWSRGCLYTGGGVPAGAGSLCGSGASVSFLSSGLTTTSCSFSGSDSVEFSLGAGTTVSRASLTSFSPTVTAGFSGPKPLLISTSTDGDSRPTSNDADPSDNEYGSVVAFPLGAFVDALRGDLFSSEASSDGFFGTLKAGALGLKLKLLEGFVRRPDSAASTARLSRLGLVLHF